MTPRIVKQKKLYLPNEKTEENAVSSLSLAPDPVFNVSIYPNERCPPFLNKMLVDVWR